MMSDDTITTDEYFGGCPRCGKTDGYTNAGRTHWFFCKAHRTMWCAGSNLFSSWRYETEDEQRRQWDEIGLETFEEVNPIHSPERFGTTKPLVADENDDSDGIPF